MVKLINENSDSKRKSVVEARIGRTKQVCVSQEYVPGYGWEDITVYDDNSYESRNQARQDVKDYRDNGFSARVITRRVSNPAYVEPEYESKQRTSKRTKKMTEALDYDYIEFATGIAEDIYDELKEDAADNNTDIGKLYTDEYPDCFYCYFKVFPYYADQDDVLTYRVYGDQYTKFIDERLEYVDLEGLFRSAWSDYKIDTRNKCIEIGIKFMFNNY